MVVVRLVSRRIHRGAWKRLQFDDYLILLAMVRHSLYIKPNQRSCLTQVTDTVLVIVMHKIVVTSSNLIPPDENVNQYDQAEIHRRIYGSKLVLVVEQMQILTTWLVKACLLIMYYRMTYVTLSFCHSCLISVSIVLPQHTLVIATAVYVAIGFVRIHVSSVDRALT